LRASEARLQLQFDRMPLGCITWDPELRVTSWNPAAQMIFGYAAAEALGKRPPDLVMPPDLKQLPQQVLERLRSGECVASTNLNVTKDGRTILCEWTNVPLQDPSGACTGVLTMVQDVTERRRVEDQLRESENRLRLIAETTDEVFWMADAAIQHMLYVSPAYERIWGRTTASLYENPLSFLDGIHPEDRVRVLEDFRLKQTGQPFQHEYRVIKPDGSIRWVWDRAYPIKEPDGAVRSYLGVAQDITDRKLLEKQLLRAQRLESIGTLSAGVAHDLNNILAPILMSAQILEMSIEDQEHKQLLATIQTSAKRGADVVRQVLTFARGAEGQRIPLQPKHLLKEIQKILQETFPKSIRLNLTAPKDLWLIMGNATHLHQVLLNLCVNARDAMPQGGELTISAENRHVRRPTGLFSDAKPGPYVLIEVRDTGQGIPAGIMEKIFEPFFTTKELGKGTGLGLSTVLGIVRSHGGIIDLHSEIGRGSIFQIYLPAEPVATAPAASNTRNAIPKGSGQCILVVDDEQNVRIVTERTLTQNGYRVLSATNGKEALDLVESHQSDVHAVVADIMMPVMDGVALAHRLKQSHPHLPIIACTGWGQEGVQTKLKALGVECVLQKPYAFEILLSALQKQLSAKS
jgi:PAS domain S-box-containing protein